MNEEQLRAELAAVYASKSWRLTAPLREATALVHRLAGLLRHPSRLPGALLRRLGRSEALRRLGSRILRRFPALHARAKRAAMLSGSAYLLAPLPPVTYVVADQDAEARLSAPARQVLAELRRAMQAQA